MSDQADARGVASRLRDLHRMIRVLEACPNIHYGVRPLVARDVEDTFELDGNTAYACLRAPQKSALAGNCGPKRRDRGHLALVRRPDALDPKCSRHAGGRHGETRTLNGDFEQA